MKEKKEIFVLKLPLKTQKYQEDIIDKRLEISRRMYNQLVAKTTNEYNQMIKTRRYRGIREELSQIYDSKTEKEKSAKKRSSRERELYQMLNDMYKEYGFTDFSMRTLANNQRQPFKKNIDSATATKIGYRLWTSWDRFLYGDGRAVHFCRYGNYNSVEGSSNKSGIRIKKDVISKKNVWSGTTPLALLWNGLEIPVVVKNIYEKEALECEVAFNRIIRETVRGKSKYYLQIVLRGKPPIKYNEKTGELKHPIGEGRVGIDVGLQTLAAVCENEVKLVPLASRVRTKDIEDQKAELQQKMDRSRRAMNPDNYNEDGTIKKQGAKKVIWVKSNHYKQMQLQLKELERKQAAVRKYQHYVLVNELLAMGNQFYVVDKNYKQMQERKDLKQKEDGSYESRKNYGKVINEKGPAMLLNLLSQKLEQCDGEYTKVSAASKICQYSHISDEYQKKETAERYDAASGCQKNLYVAFLLTHMLDATELDKAGCKESFETFKKMHDALFDQMRQQKESGTKFPASMGI